MGNSYHSSPALNRLDWARARQYHALVDYYRGLLALRAAFPRLGTTDRHAPEALQFFSLEQPLVGWTLPAAPGDGAWWRALCVLQSHRHCPHRSPAHRAVEAAERRHFFQLMAGREPHL